MAISEDYIIENHKLDWQPLDKDDDILDLIRKLNYNFQQFALNNGGTPGKDGKDGEDGAITLARCAITGPESGKHYDLKTNDGETIGALCRLNNKYDEDFKHPEYYERIYGDLYPGDIVIYGNKTYKYTGGERTNKNSYIKITEYYGKTGKEGPKGDKGNDGLSYFTIDDKNASIGNNTKNSVLYFQPTDDKTVKFDINALVLNKDTNIKPNLLENCSLYLAKSNDGISFLTKNDSNFYESEVKLTRYKTGENSAFAFRDKTQSGSTFSSTKMFQIVVPNANAKLNENPQSGLIQVSQTRNTIRNESIQIESSHYVSKTTDNTPLRAVIDIGLDTTDKYTGPVKIGTETTQGSYTTGKYHIHAVRFNWIQMTTLKGNACTFDGDGLRIKNTNKRDITEEKNGEKVVVQTIIDDSKTTITGDKIIISKDIKTTSVGSNETVTDKSSTTINGGKITTKEIVSSGSNSDVNINGVSIKNDNTIIDLKGIISSLNDRLKSLENFSLPVGSIISSCIPYSSKAENDGVLEGFLYCDGRAVNKTSTGFTVGGNECNNMTNTFFDNLPGNGNTKYLPNLVGKFLMGAEENLGTTQYYTGGNKTITLKEEQMPPHKHWIPREQMSNNKEYTGTKIFISDTDDKEDVKLTNNKYTGMMYTIDHSSDARPSYKYFTSQCGGVEEFKEHREDSNIIKGQYHREKRNASSIDITPPYVKIYYYIKIR